jgi:hypothetical protein
LAITKVQQPQTAATTTSGTTVNKTKEVLEKELAEGQKAYSSINDYLDLRKESNLGKIMEKNKENLAKTNIFSDYVTRINSNSERSLKIIVISSKLQ